MHYAAESDQTSRNEVKLPPRDYDGQTDRPHKDRVGHREVSLPIPIPRAHLQFLILKEGMQVGKVKERAAHKLDVGKPNGPIGPALHLAQAIVFDHASDENKILCA